MHGDAAEGATRALGGLLRGDGENLHLPPDLGDRLFGAAGLAGQGIGKAPEETFDLAFGVELAFGES